MNEIVTFLIKGLGDYSKYEALLMIFEEEFRLKKEKIQELFLASESVGFSGAKRTTCETICKRLQGIGFIVEYKSEENDKLKIEVSHPGFIEVNKIKEEVGGLQNRINVLEKNFLSGSEVCLPVKQTVDKPFEVKKSTEVQKKQVKKHEGIENWIGKVGLNIIGTVTLILGVVFLVGYAARDFLFSPAGRVLSGIVISSALVGLGKYLFNKERYKQFAASIMGGGWAGLYFVAYACYNIDIVKFIHNPAVGFALLLVVAGLIIKESISYNSRLLIALGSGLGFLSSIIHPASLYTVFAALLLAAAVVVIGYKKEWEGVPIIGLIGVYVAHYAWSITNVSVVNFNWHFQVLLLHWAIFFSLSFVPVCIKEAMRFTTTVINLLNIAFFVLVYQIIALKIHPEVSWIVFTALGVVYLLKKAYFVVNQKQIISSGTDVLVGISLFSCAAFLRLANVGEILFYAVEFLVLVEFGNIFKDKRYSIFGAVASVIALIKYMILIETGFASVLIFGLSQGLLLGIICSVIAIFSAARIQRKLQDQDDVYAFLGSILCVVAFLFSFFAVLFEFSGVQQCVALALLFVLYSELSFLFHSRIYLFLSCFTGVVVGFLVLLTNFVATKTFLGVSNEFLILLPVAGSYFFNALRFRSARQDAFSLETTRFSFNLTSVMGMGVLFLMIPREFTSNLYSIWWGGLGFLLLLIGFYLQEKVFRYGGLLFFAIVILKLFFVDIVDLPIMIKIISFIVLGVFLLVASFAYAKLKDKD